MAFIKFSRCLENELSQLVTFLAEQAGRHPNSEVFVAKNVLSVQGSREHQYDFTCIVWDADQIAQICIGCISGFLKFFFHLVELTLHTIGTVLILISEDELDSGFVQGTLGFRNFVQSENRDFQYPAKILTHFTFDVYEDKVWYSQAKDRKLLVKIGVASLNGKNAFAVKHKDFFGVCVICAQQHRIETLGAAAAAYVELRSQ